MATILFTMPLGNEWTCTMSTVPRVNEHVDINGYHYRVSRVLYYTSNNTVRVALEEL